MTLRERAMAACDGPWFVEGDDGVLAAVYSKRCHSDGANIGIADDMRSADAHFIAAANPSAILMLLDRADVMQVVADAAREWRELPIPRTEDALCAALNKLDKLDKIARGSNPFLVAINSADENHVARLALLFLVRAAMRAREQLGQPTPRQLELEQAASAYPLPGLGAERRKMLIAARTRGLIDGDPPALTAAGNALLAPFDEAI